MTEAAKLAEREQIARIIDPRAFEGWQGQYDFSMKTEGPEFAQRCADHFCAKEKQDALAKADAILAIRSSSDPDAVPDIIAILDEIEVDEDGRCEWTAVANAQQLIKAAHRHTPAVTETEVILDAINDRNPRTRQAIDLLLYKFDVYPRAALTEKPSNTEGGK